MNAIISATELADALRSERPPVLLDVRWQLSTAAASGQPFDGRAAYASGHIPGAVFVDLDRELASAPGPQGAIRCRTSTCSARRCGARACPRERPWSRTTAASGGRRPAPGGCCAGPVTRTYGSWTADCPPGTARWRRGRRRRPRATSCRSRRRAACWTRTARRRWLVRGYCWTHVRGAVPGRGGADRPRRRPYPGAVSAPTSENVDADGRFRPAAELRARFGEMGVAQDVPVGVYCGSGVSAAHEVLALAIAGIPAALYVGSWSEWSSDPQRPVAVGPDPQ